MSETRPRLEVVPGEGASAGSPGEAPDAGGRVRRTPWIVGGLLVIALLLCAGGWIAQARRTAHLEQSLAASQAALADTRAELGRAEGRLAAFDAHLGAARDRVERLARQIGALSAFLAEGPAEGASE
jgi:uncharacterized protein HemX